MFYFVTFNSYSIQEDGNFATSEILQQKILLKSAIISMFLTIVYQIGAKDFFAVIVIKKFRWTMRSCCCCLPCCLPCNHCSNWTWVVGRNFGLLVLGYVLRTAGNSIIWNYADPLTHTYIHTIYRKKRHLTEESHSIINHS